MSQRTGLLIAVLLTAFILVVGGAIVGRTTQPEKPPAETAVVQQSAAVQQLMERESAYQDLTRQANERLQQAYAKLQAQAAATSPAYLFSPEQAANIAMQIAPGAVLLNLPELVDYQGAMAYKVSLNTGLVYVDANSGQVLYNGILTLVSVGPSNNGPAKSERNAAKAGRGEKSAGGNGGGESGGGEHESEGGGGD
jgi:uncharacterized membrane protein YgcG